MRNSSKHPSEIFAEIWPVFNEVLSFFFKNALHFLRVSCVDDLVRILVIFLEGATRVPTVILHCKSLLVVGVENIHSKAIYHVAVLM